MPTLDWRNRDEATKTAARVPVRALLDVPELSFGGAASGRAGDGARRDAAPPENLLVHGDNLAALKALLPFAAGLVKCIYIDPPYNTGSAFEHYDDNLEHSTWLSLMYPRLELLREFLSEDGSIWISIDDREGAYLQILCDEIFGRANFVANVSWQRTYSTRNDAKGIVNEVEHILVYSKRQGWQPNKLARTEKMDSIYKNPDNDPQGPWTSGDAFAADGAAHQGMVYAIQNPFDGTMIYPYASAHWRYGQEEMLAHMNGWCPYELREIDDAEKRAEICGVGVDEVRKGVKAIVLAGVDFNAETQRRREGEQPDLLTPNGVRPIGDVSRVSGEQIRLLNNKSSVSPRLCVENFEESRKMATAVLKRGPWPKFYFTKNGKGGIRRKTYLSAVGDVPPTNLFEYRDVGHTDEAKKEILKLFDGKSPFATPKPERLIQRILQIATNPGDLVLDSFLGSGTTAAVAHKMGRRWIGVELGDHARTHCAVRLRKVVEGEQGGISKAVGWTGGGSFRFLELGEEIFDADGAVRAEVPWEVLAAHVWFTETKTGWRLAAAPPGAMHNEECRMQNAEGRSPVLGIHEGVAYALLYNGILHDRRVDGGNVLTRRTLALIREDLARLFPGETPKRLTVFAEWSRLGPETLAAERIEFRQTPYDLKGGR